MDAQVEEQPYFKEYTCYEFDTTNYKDQSQDAYDIEFTTNFCQDINSLPSALIDKLAQRQMLYLLHWEESNQHSYRLYLKSLGDNRWRRLVLKYLPTFCVISGAALYLLNNQQLYIKSLEGMEKCLCRLLPEQLVCVNACMVRVSASRHEPGIEVIYFSKKKGYFAKYYSIHQQTLSQEGILSKSFTILSIKHYIEFMHFEVIIPKLLAIVFHSSHRFSFFNIQAGQIVEESTQELICGTLGREKALVRWKEDENDGQHRKLILGIGYQSNIDLFLAEFTVKPELVQQLSQVRLSGIGESAFIDWHHTMVSAFTTIPVDGNYIVDFMMANKGVIYMGKKNEHSEIPNCSYIDLNLVFSSIPILTQQSTIWRLFYADKLYSELTQQDTFYVPNRYGQLVRRQKDWREGDDLGMRLLQKWRANCRFTQIINFNQEILIIRRESVSVFRLIQEYLYRQQYFKQEQFEMMDRLQLQKDNQASKIERMLAKQDELYLGRQFNGYLSRGRVCLPRFKIVKEEDYEDIHDEQQRNNRQFYRMMEEIESIFRAGMSKIYSTMNIKQFAHTLACNQLYDKLNYYHLLCSKKSFRIDQNSIRESTKNYQYELSVIKVINYYYQLLSTSARHHQVFDHHLISLFLSEHRNLSSVDVDISIASYLKLLFANLFPLKKSNYQNSQINPDDNYDQNYYTNRFVEFIIQQLVKSVDEEHKEKEDSLREELSHIINIGLLDVKSIFFSHLWKSTSLFRALLLSNNSVNFVKYFNQFLLKSDYWKMLEEYRKLQKYMTSKHIGIIQNILLLQKNSHQLGINLQEVLKHRQAVKESYLQPSHELIQRTKEDLYRRDIINLPKVEEVEKVKKIRGLVCKLKERELFEPSIFEEMKRQWRSLHFQTEQKYLQFYDNLLRELLQLYRQKEKSTKAGEDEQATNKKKELSYYYSQIEHIYDFYKSKYQQVYEESIKDTGKELLASIDKVLAVFVL